MKIVFIIFSILLLIYMLWPSPKHISQFKPLPNSEKSTLEGDTIQIPNVSAYFSNNFRGFVIPFYSKDYQNLVKLPFPPFKLNHPPEYSWVVIKRHTDSTYIEEFFYPLRDSLYANGLEPFYEDRTPKFWGATKFEMESKDYLTKVTLRFYPSSVLDRFIVWAGIMLSILLLFKFTKKVFAERYE